MWLTGAWKRKPTATPTSVTRISVNVRARDRRDRRAGEDRRPAHRQRAEAVGDPLRHVLGDAHGQRRATEDRRLHEDPGDQEIGVVLVARARGSSRRRRSGRAARRSRAAPRRTRPPVACAAASAGCAGRSRACRSGTPRASSGARGARSRSCGAFRLRRSRPPRCSGAPAASSASAPRPVSARNTSSSDGRCTPRSSIGIPASSRHEPRRAGSRPGSRPGPAAAARARGS